MKHNSTPPRLRSELHEALLKHYDRTARELPWRQEPDPYRVLVSEVMLQQTRVETVLGYYGPWLQRFPSIEALAVADGDEVLKAWEGLGYYRRAQNLHRAARVVRETHGGVIPSTYAQLRELPGVGEYTAGAVASIAFGERVPAVDGNVRRVFARLFDVAEPKPAWLRATASQLVDAARPGDWNQALMELGATVCTPRSPRCGECPLAEPCAARAAGTQAERPAVRAKRAVPTVVMVLALLHRRGEVLIVKRGPEGLLSGLWAFPERRLGGGSGGRGASVSESSDIAWRFAESLGLTPVTPPVPLPECRHRFTHLDAVYVPWAIEVTGDPKRVATDPWTEVAWVDPLETGERAFPSAQRRVLATWNEHLRVEAS